MSPEERAGREAVFKRDRFRVISYSRTTASFDRKTGAIVKQTSGLAPLVTTAGITSLSMTLSVAYDREAACCTWLLQAYFDWGNWPLNGFDGKDQIALAIGQQSGAREFLRPGKVPR
jgi:hypothetical protein